MWWPLALSISMALGLLALRQPQAAPHPTVQLRQGPRGRAIWGVWTGRSYAFGLEAGEHEVVLIDSGSDPQARSLLGMLAQRGYTASSVHTIILTHGSDAQTAALHQFKQASIWVHTDDATLARRDVLPRPFVARLMARFTRTPLPKPRLQPLWPGQFFSVGAAVAQIVPLPGYTPGSVAVVFESLAFVGDSLVGGPHGPALATQSTSANPLRNRDALCRLGRFDFEQIVTSSTGPLPWGRTRLCAWLRALPAPQQPPAPLIAQCHDDASF